MPYPRLPSLDTESDPNSLSDGPSAPLIPQSQGNPNLREYKAYTDAQGAYHPYMSSETLADPTTGRPYEHDLPTDNGDRSPLRPISQVLAERVQQKGAYEDAPTYLADARKHAYDLARAMGIDLQSQQGQQWMDQTLMAAKGAAQEFVKPPVDPKRFHEMSNGNMFDTYTQKEIQTHSGLQDLLHTEDQHKLDLTTQAQESGIQSPKIPSKSETPSAPSEDAILQKLDSMTSLQRNAVFNDKNAAYLQTEYQKHLKDKDAEKELLGSSSSIPGDVRDILEGRNTLFNIRQTMGKNNTTKKYTEEIRRRIDEVDPKFDFVASDAGGKSVSSAYVQRSMAAVDSVLPNIDKIIDLSSKVPRGDVRALNSLMQDVGIQFGDKKVANFVQAQKLIADEIGAALGAGSASDMKLQLGFDVTDPKMPPDVFASNMEIVKEFLNNRRKGLTGLRYSSSTVDSSNDQKIDLNNIAQKFIHNKARAGDTGTLGGVKYLFDGKSVKPLK